MIFESRLIVYLKNPIQGKIKGELGAEEYLIIFLLITVDIGALSWVII